MCAPLPTSVDSSSIAALDPVAPKPISSFYAQTANPILKNVGPLTKPGQDMWAGINRAAAPTQQASLKAVSDTEAAAAPTQSASLKFVSALGINKQVAGYAGRTVDRNVGLNVNS